MENNNNTSLHEDPKRNTTNGSVALENMGYFEFKKARDDQFVHALTSYCKSKTENNKK